jgi:VanZ family protein
VKFDFDHVFSPSTLVFLAISSGREGTTLFVNGQRAQFYPRFEITLGDMSGQIVLGTASTGYRPWSGEMRGLAIYAKELTPGTASQHYLTWTDPNRYPPADSGDAIVRYSFKEGSGTEIHNEVAPTPELTVPAIFAIPHKAFLQSPAKEFKTSRSYIFDALTNVAGFVPLGVVVFAYFAWARTRWKAVLTTIACCGLLSLAIEISQYFIPQRGSGITDVITNTLGASLGALLAQWHLVRKPLEKVGILPVSGESVIRSRTPC